MTGMFASPRRLYVNGAALWAPLLPGWQLAREILAGRMAAPATPLGRPAPELLPPNERRRAPDTVAVALEAALAACKCADLEPATLACVFSSMHGDLTITDYMCATLASTPAQLSPTRFHNSVHNAAAGYWTIAAECTRPYTALSAGEHTFGAALLEASVQALSTAENILLVTYDIDARGPLAAMARSKGLLSAALVLGPARGSRALAHFDLSLTSRSLTPSHARPENEALVAGNASAACLPFMEALALGGAREIRCLAAPVLGLSLQLAAG